VNVDRFRVNRVKTQSAPMLCEHFELHGRWRAGRIAVIFEEARLSWGELCLRIHQVANGLTRLGIGRDHTVAVLIDNRLETIEVLLGVIRSGAVVVPINLTISDEAIRRQLHDCRASLLIATPAEARRIDGLDDLSGLAPGRRIVIGGALSGWLEYGVWRDSQSAAAPEFLPASDDPCTIIYSSGTTGEPKGILHSHQGRLAYAQDGALALRMHEDCITVCSLGFYSNATWLTLTSAFLIGGTVVVVPRFEPESFLRTVEQTATTHLFLVPLQYQMLVDCPARASYDASSLQVLFAAGSVMTAALKERVSAWVHCAFVEAYGLTEGFVTILSDRDGRRKPTSVGRPMHGGDLRILKQDDSAAVVGEPGEIVGWSRLIMHSYFNRPAETEAVFWTDAGGRRWLRTGDIGYLDEEGFLYLLDRKKDMIVSGGQNVFPIDIETVAAGHPAVAQVAVVGLPHQKWGETPVAIVVHSGEAQVSSDELMAWINERVGKRQRVSAVMFQSSLPRNALGKVLKRELRARLAGTLTFRTDRLIGDR